MSAIQGFQLSQGGDIEKYDYNALDNKLELDTTLQISGQAADAAVVGSKFGDLANLKTINKINLVGAINENVDNLEILTTAKGDLSELETTSTHSLVAAINEINNKTGDLEELNTEANGNLVHAVNEVNSKTYNDLELKPSINNQILNSGNNTLNELGIASKDNVYTKTEIDNKITNLIEIKTFYLSEDQNIDANSTRQIPFIIPDMQDITWYFEHVLGISQIVISTPSGGIYGNEKLVLEGYHPQNLSSSSTNNAWGIAVIVKNLTNTDVTVRGGQGYSSIVLSYLK